MNHAKSLQDAKKTASALGIKLESAATPTEQWQLQVVKSFSADQFDRWYSSLEVKDHQQDIQESSDEAKLGSSPEVITLAKNDLPVLRQHLKLAQAAQKASG